MATVTELSVTAVPFAALLSSRMMTVGSAKVVAIAKDRARKSFMIAIIDVDGDTILLP